MREVKELIRKNRVLRRKINRLRNYTKMYKFWNEEGPLHGWADFASHLSWIEHDCHEICELIEEIKELL